VARGLFAPALTIAAILASASQAQRLDVDPAQRSSFRQPIAVQTGKLITGEISESDYVAGPAWNADVFTITGRAGEVVSLQLQSEIPTLEVHIHSAKSHTGRAITEGPARAAPILFVVPKDGAYFIAVHAKGPQRLGKYQLSIGSSAAAPPFEPFVPRQNTAATPAVNAPVAQASGRVLQALTSPQATATAPVRTATPGPFENPQAWGLFAEIAKRGAVLTSRSGASIAYANMENGQVVISHIFKLGPDGNLYWLQPPTGADSARAYRGRVAANGSVLWETLHTTYTSRISRDDWVDGQRRFSILDENDLSVRTGMTMAVEPISKYIPAEKIGAARDLIDAWEGRYDDTVTQIDAQARARDAADAARWARRQAARERTERSLAFLNNLSGALSIAEDAATQSEARSRASLEATLEQARRSQQIARSPATVTTLAPGPASPAVAGQPKPVATRAQAKGNNPDVRPGTEPAQAGGAGRQCPAVAEKYHTAGIPWETREVAYQSLMDHPRAATFVDVSCAKNGSLWMCTANIPTGRMIERCGPTSASRQ